MFHEGEKVMKIDLMDWNGEKSYALYDNFRVAEEKVKLLYPVVIILKLSIKH